MRITTSRYSQGTPIIYSCISHQQLQDLPNTSSPASQQTLTSKACVFLKPSGTESGPCEDLGTHFTPLQPSHLTEPQSWLEAPGCSAVPALPARLSPSELPVPFDAGGRACQHDRCSKLAGLMLLEASFLEEQCFKVSNSHHAENKLRMLSVCLQVACLQHEPRACFFCLVLSFRTQAEKHR